MHSSSTSNKLLPARWPRRVTFNTPSHKLSYDFYPSLSSSRLTNLSLRTGLQNEYSKWCLKMGASKRHSRSLKLCRSHSTLRKASCRLLDTKSSTRCLNCTNKKGWVHLQKRKWQGCSCTFKMISHQKKRQCLNSASRISTPPQFVTPNIRSNGFQSESLRASPLSSRHCCLKLALTQRKTMNKLRGHKPLYTYRPLSISISPSRSKILIPLNWSIAGRWAS